MKIPFTGLLILISLQACTNQSPFEMAKAGPTMRESYENHMAGGKTQDREMKASISRTQENDINYQGIKQRAFRANRRIANPELAMFIYPHRATRHGLIVPGYILKFPMFEKVQYGLPGDVIDAQ